MNAAAELICEELHARCWSHGMLAHRMGRPISEVVAIIHHRQEITPEIAAALGEAFGTSAKFWLNLGANPSSIP